MYSMVRADKPRLEHLSIEALHVHLPDGTDKSRAKNRPDVKPQQRLVVLEGPRSDPWFGHIRQPLVEKLVESNGSGARRLCHVPLLQPQVEATLGFPEGAVDSLVVVFARPSPRIATLIDADKPRALSARNDLP